MSRHRHRSTINDVWQIGYPPHVPLVHGIRRVGRFLRSVAAVALSFSAVAVVAAGAVVASDSSPPQPRASLLLVRGADGTDEFGRMFEEWTARWNAAAVRGGVAVRTIGLGTSSDLRPFDELRQAVADETDGSERPLWIVLIGHGTYDGRAAKFNLTGPDVTAKQLAVWLAPLRRPLAVINCASSSSPFLDRLSQPGRVVISATKDGHEVNFARFGGHLATAIGDLAADLDKDGQVSLLEAFLTASRQTHAAYEALRQLPTEHALLDDNGDGRGVHDDFFEGVRPVQSAEQGQTLDGHRAEQWYFIPSDEERRFPQNLLPHRNDLELEIARLRDRKTELDEEIYYAELERLLVALAELYEQADLASPAALDDSPGDEGDTEIEAVP